MVGSLKASDPPELRDALRQAIAHAIEAKKSRKELQEWEAVLKSTVFHFEVFCPQQDFE